MASSEHCRPSASIVSPCVSMAIESRGTGLVGLALTLGAGIRCGCDRRLAQPHAGPARARPTVTAWFGLPTASTAATGGSRTLPAATATVGRGVVYERSAGMLRGDGAVPSPHRAPIAKSNSSSPGPDRWSNTGPRHWKSGCPRISKGEKSLPDRDRRLGHARENVQNTSHLQQNNKVTAVRSRSAQQHAVHPASGDTPWSLGSTRRSETFRRKRGACASIRWTAAPTTTGSRAGGRARAESSGERAMRPRPRRADPTVSRRRRTGT